jgi:hypothetical protein
MRNQRMKPAIHNEVVRKLELNGGAGRGLRDIALEAPLAESTGRGGRGFTCSNDPRRCTWS